MKLFKRFTEGEDMRIAIFGYKKHNKGIFFPPSYFTFYLPKICFIKIYPDENTN